VAVTAVRVIDLAWRSATLFPHQSSGVGFACFATHANPATPGSGTVPRNSAAGSAFPGLSRGFLNPAAGKAASPLAAGPTAGSNFRPGKDPGRF